MNGKTLRPSRKPHCLQTTEMSPRKKYGVIYNSADLSSKLRLTWRFLYLYTYLCFWILKKSGSFTPVPQHNIYKYVDMCLSRWNFPGLLTETEHQGDVLPTANAMAFLLRAFYCFAEWLLPSQKVDMISSHQGTDSVWRGRVTRPLGDVHGSAGRFAECNRWSILNWHGLRFRVQLCKQTWCCPLSPQ